MTIYDDEKYYKTISAIIGTEVEIYELEQELESKKNYLTMLKIHKVKLEEGW